MLVHENLGLDSSIAAAFHLSVSCSANIEVIRLDRHIFITKTLIMTHPKLNRTYSYVMQVSIEIRKVWILAARRLYSCAHLPIPENIIAKKVKHNVFAWITISQYQSLSAKVGTVFGVPVLHGHVRALVESALTPAA